MFYREYKEGVHLFQFTWNADQNNHVSVGVCTKEMHTLEHSEIFLVYCEKSKKFNITYVS